MTKSKVEPLPSKRHQIQTPDGWTLTLIQYPASKTAPKHHPTPVLLVHGLAANETCFELRQDKSMAGVLSDGGYDSWAINLRGHGASKIYNGKRKVVRFDTNGLLNDIKMGMDYILLHHRAAQLHYIGHSQGGMLGLVLSSAFYDYAAKLCSLTTLASGFFNQDSEWRYFEWTRRLEFFTPFLPTRLLGKLYSPFILCPNFMANIRNSNRADLQALLRNFDDICIQQFKEFCTGFHPDGYMLDIGQGPQRMAGLLQDMHVPVLMIAPDVDRQITATSVERTFQLVGSPMKRLLLCGRRPDFQHHHGHNDVMVGKHTHSELFPKIVDFLHSCDGASSSSVPRPLTSVHLTPTAKRVPGAFDDVLPGEVIPLSQALRGTALDLTTHFHPSTFSTRHVAPPMGPYPNPKTAMPDIEQAIAQQQQLQQSDSMRAREDEHLGAIEVTPPRHNRVKHLSSAGAHPNSLKASQ